jgi:hypothetical protein
VTADAAALRRIHRRALVFTTLSAAATSFFDWRAAVSLTIAAAVVVFSVLVLEKLTDRLVLPQAKSGFRRMVPFLLVTAASVLLLGVAAFRWKDFSLAGGAIGISVAVAAIVSEGFVRGERQGE